MVTIVAGSDTAMGQTVGSGDRQVAPSRQNQSSSYASSLKNINCGQFSLHLIL